MKQALSKLLLAVLIASNVSAAPVTADVKYVDDIGKPIKNEILDQDTVTQELLEEIEASLQQGEEVKFYKYFTDTRIPKGYKYNINADYTEIKDAGLSKTNELSGKAKMNLFNWLLTSWFNTDITVGKKTSTTVHQDIIYHEKRILSNKFDKLRTTAVWPAFVSACKSLFAFAGTGTLLKLVSSSKNNEMIFVSATATALSLSSLILYIQKARFYRNVPEIKYLENRAVSDTKAFNECDDIEREFDNPNSKMKVFTALILSLAAGAATASYTSQA